MNAHVMPARPRGLIGGARAEANTPQEIFNDLKKMMVEFRSSVDEELKEIKSKQSADVVTTERVERINENVTKLENELKEANRLIAAATLGAGSTSDPNDAAKREHANAFDKFFRRGVEAGLRDLEIKAATSTDSDPDGGYLVPAEMESGIDQILRDTSVMRQLANVMTIGTDTYKKLVNMGGSSSGWVGEKEARPETDTPTLRELIFNVQELYANPASTQKMLDDGILDVTGWIGDEVREEFAMQESKAFIQGDGVQKPKGLWSYDKVANDNWKVVENWGTFGYVPSGKADGFVNATASASPADCLIDLVYSLKQQFRSGAVFLMNDKTAGTVRKFKNADGEFIWRDPTAAETLPTVLGKQVYTDDYTPVVGAGTFPIAFGNFGRTYTIFDRQGIRVLRDPFTNKPYVHFYTTKRVGAGATHFQAMKFLKIGTS